MKIQARAEEAEPVCPRPAWDTDTGLEDSCPGLFWHSIQSPNTGSEVQPHPVYLRQGVCKHQGMIIGWGPKWQYSGCSSQILPNYPSPHQVRNTEVCELETHCFWFYQICQQIFYQKFSQLCNWDWVCKNKYSSCLFLWVFSIQPTIPIAPGVAHTQIPSMLRHIGLQHAQSSGSVTVTRHIQKQFQGGSLIGSRSLNGR